MAGRLGIWPPLPPLAHLRRPGPLPYPFGEPGTRVFARARHGLHAAAVALGLGRGDEVLVPAYHHGSEVEALLAAGATCRFYDGGDRLEPDEDELESLLSSNTRALHLTHFLGFPQDARRWRRWTSERGLLLLEDAAMAWLAERDGQPVGSVGDAAIWCLYKSVAVPDGGAARVGATILLAGEAPTGTRAVLQRHVWWLASYWGWVRRPGRRPPAPYDPVRSFALGEPRPATRATRRLLPRLAGPGVATARRANHRALAAALGDLVPEPFAELPEGASPFVFPVAAEDKEGLLAHLADRGIEALALWSVPHPSLDVEAFPRARRLRETVVGLPVHQELGPRNLARIAAAVRAWRG